MASRTVKSVVRPGIAALAAWLAGVNAAHAVVPTTSAERLAAIDSFVEENMRALGIPGASIVVSENGEVVYVRHFGVATADGKPVGDSTAFNVGSVSKSFAAVVIGQLEEEGYLDLDDNVVTHLPWFRTADEEASDQITIRHLLTHSSGISTLAGHTYHDERRTDQNVYQDTVREVAKMSLISKPGERHVYSNANYLVLGCLVEQITGLRYEDVVGMRVLKPAGMESSFVIDVTRDGADVADGFRYWFGQPMRYGERTGRVLGAQQGVYASALDLTRYLQEFVKETPIIVNNDYRSAMMRNAAQGRSPGFGMGWRTVAFNDYRLIYHYGTGQGYNAVAGFVPESNLTYVALINANRSFGARNLIGFVGAVRDILLDRGVRTVEPPTRDRILRVVLTGLPALLCILIFNFLRRVRSGRISPLPDPAPALDLVVRLAAPSIVSGAIAVILAFTPAAAANGTLSSALVYSPDLGWLLVVSITILAAWAVARPFIRYRVGRASGPG